MGVVACLVEQEKRREACVYNKTSEKDPGAPAEPQRNEPSVHLCDSTNAKNESAPRQMPEQTNEEDDHRKSIQTRHMQRKAKEKKKRVDVRCTSFIHSFRSSRLGFFVHCWRCACHCQILPVSLDGSS